ncbi:MAG: response regulator [Acetobacteraceae bacterium]
MPDRIVIIEDDEATRYAYERALATAGFRTASFQDYFAAAPILDQGGGALLLLDIKMPDGTPQGVSIAMMARRGRPNLPILFVTGFPELVRWIDNDFGSVLMKPVDSDALINAVRARLQS